MRPLTFAHLKAAFKAFQADNCSRLAAAMAFYALLSIFPMLLLLIVLAGTVMNTIRIGGVDAEQYILNLVNTIFPASGRFVANSLRVAQTQRQGVGLFGVVALWWSASNFFYQLDAAIDAIWKTPSRPATWFNRLLAIGMVLGLAGTLFLLMIANTVLRAVQLSVAVAPAGGLLSPLASILGSILVTTAAFALVFRYLPNREVRWRDVWPGALVGAVAWEVLRQVLAWYLTGLADFSAVYGPVGSVIALLTWIYFGGQVFLFAAEMAAVSTLQWADREGAG